MADDEEKKDGGGEELIPILEDDDSPAGTAYIRVDDGDTHPFQGPVINVESADDDDIFDEKTDISKKDGTIEDEFAKAAKDGTLYEKYSEYLKRNEERLKDPNFANLKDSIKEHIRQLKEAYYDVAGLSKKICPDCGQAHEKDAEFSTCHGSQMYVAGQCRACGADLSSAQGYSAINNCPKCGAELTVPQKKIINGLLIKTQAETKYACSKCGKIYDSIIKYCQDCGSKILPMQCVQCGETLRQNGEGKFDKHCPVCGMINPLETAAPQPSKKSGIGLKTLIFVAIIAAISIFYIKQKKAPVILPPLSISENNESGKDRMGQLEKAKAEQKKAEETRQQQETIKLAEAAGSLKNNEVGDIIEFGSYPYYENGTEKAIEWKILEKYSDGIALVISKYALDALRYNETSINITWEKSTIRKWLNNDFYNKAFGNVNKNLILNNHLENKGHSIWTTSGGKNTWDYIFLLSTDEARKYFDSEKSRVTEATPYAEKKGVATISYLKENKYNEWKEKIRQWDADGVPDSSCRWWLRSPGSNQKLAVYVSHGGYVRDGGKDVNGIQNASIRPAFKINLDKFAQQ